MNTTEGFPRSRVRSLLGLIESILESEGESNWIRGIRAARGIADDLAVADSEALAEVASIYRTMQAGPGGFSDYFIWRESPEERIRANKDLEAATAELWKVLEEARHPDEGTEA